MRVRERVRISGNKAMIRLRVPCSEATAYLQEECVLDTGSPFHLLVSSGFAQCLKPLAFQHCRDIRLADDSVRSTMVYLGEICWLDSEPKEIPVTVMDPCPDPMLGLPLLTQTKIILGEKDGYVESL